MAKIPASLTGGYLSGRLQVEEPVAPLPAATQWMRLAGAELHNLKKFEVAIPIGRMTAVSGVSGSGKSSLIRGCLLPLLQNKALKMRNRVADLGKLDCDELPREVVLVDQASIGGTPRSTPVSYTKMLDGIRDLFASLPESKVRGYRSSRFSYNMKDGRCPVCEGRGAIFMEMHFLSDVWEKCEACHGARYNPDTLRIKHRGKNVAEILDMTFEEAEEHFHAHPKLKRTCSVFREIGLGYLKLGQSGTALSGGESQRMKLATELARNPRGTAAYFLDEPTTGLHLDDIRKLWKLLRGLVQKGHTVIVVEHHPEVLRRADWLLDLGPEGGEGGGQLLYQGVPTGIAKLKGNATAAALYPR